MLSASTEKQHDLLSKPLRGKLLPCCSTAAQRAMSTTMHNIFAWDPSHGEHQCCDSGAYQEGGRGLSIWDTFSHEKGHTDKGDTGDVAVDFYHRYQEVRDAPWEINDNNKQ